MESTLLVASRLPASCNYTCNLNDVGNTSLQPKGHENPNTHDTCTCASDHHDSKQPIASVSSIGATSDELVAKHFRALNFDMPSMAMVEDIYAIMEEEIADAIVEQAQKQVGHALAKSSSSIQTSVVLVPKFTIEDLTRGDLLGAGGFGSVYAVDIKEPSRLCSHKPGQQYAVKHLSPKLASLACTPQQKRRLQSGVKDLVLESHILAALDHPNIIQLHGLSLGGLSNFASTRRTDAYFMILPRLNCTLTDKINGWKRQRQSTVVVPSKTSAPWWRPISPSTNSNKQTQDLKFLCQRLEILVDLCSALDYLHSKRIMHRDVKPQNIGFDQEGTLKLFDMGLAKELPPDSDSYSQGDAHPMNIFDSKAFLHMGNTGTTRYMAPEVIRRESYNCKVDIYASCIVCWEIMTLKKPYGNDVSGQFVKECVALYNDRPVIPKSRSKKEHTIWPKALRKLVQRGWAKDIALRPSAGQMKAELLEILAKRKQQQLQSQCSNGEKPLEATSKPISLAGSFTHTMSC